MRCNLSRTTEEGNTKPWLPKADWEAWRNVLEKSSHASLEAVQCLSATDQWGSVLVDITEATRWAIPYKRSSRHSKPFWSEELSQKGAELRALRKNSSTAPTTQMERDLIMRKMSLRAFYLRNLRSGCEKL